MECNIVPVIRNWVLQYIIDRSILLKSDLLQTISVCRGARIENQPVEDHQHRNQVLLNPSIYLCSTNLHSSRRRVSNTVQSS